MISSSSNNRTPGQCDAVLTVGPESHVSTATRSAVGPLRLPLKDPGSFVSRFNRIYSRIGLSLQVASTSDAYPTNLTIEKTAMDDETKSDETKSDDITSASLRQKKCVPCEGGVPVVDAQAAQVYLQALPDWSLDDDGKRIFRKLNAGNFVKATKMIQQIAELAESEQHHPDLHLTGYRYLTIALTTHAIGGLSENDFVVAAKIDTLIG